MRNDRSRAPLTCHCEPVRTLVWQSVILIPNRNTGFDLERRTGEANVELSSLSRPRNAARPVGRRRGRRPRHPAVRSFAAAKRAIRESPLRTVFDLAVGEGLRALPRRPHRTAVGRVACARRAREKLGMRSKDCPFLRDPGCPTKKPTPARGVGFSVFDASVTRPIPRCR